MSVAVEVVVVAVATIAAAAVAVVVAEAVVVVVVATVAAEVVRQVAAVVEATSLRKSWRIHRNAVTTFLNRLMKRTIGNSRATLVE